MINWIARLLVRDSGEPTSGARSGRWPRVRAEHLKREPRCQACGGVASLEVHHVVPVHVAVATGRPELELDPTNLITLCADPCHLVHGHLMSWQRWAPSVREDVAAYRMRVEAAKARQA